MKNLLNCIVFVALSATIGCSDEKPARREFSPFAGYWAESNITEYRRLRQEDHLALNSNKPVENKGIAWVCGRVQPSSGLSKKYVSLNAYKIGSMGHVYEYRVGAARIAHQPVWQTDKAGAVSKSTLTEFAGTDSKIVAQEMKMIDPNTIANIYTVKKAGKDPEQVEVEMVRTSEQELIEIATMMDGCK